MLVDIHAYPQYTKYPLADQSTGYLGNVLFPYKDILSLTLQCTTLEDYHINSIVLAKQYIRLSFKPFNLIQQLTCDVFPNTQQAFVTNNYGKIAGNMLYVKQLYADLLALLYQLGSMKLLDIKNNILKIHQSCLVLFSYNNTQCYYINNKACTQNINLYFTNNTQCINTNDQISVNVFGDCPLNDTQLIKSIVKSIQIQNTDGQSQTFNCQNKHLVIKHSGLSDLRVITANNSIKLTGVMDA